MPEWTRCKEALSRAASPRRKIIVTIPPEMIVTAERLCYGMATAVKLGNDQMARYVKNICLTDTWAAPRLIHRTGTRRRWRTSQDLKSLTRLAVIRSLDP